jgi:hypothetical protein
MSAFTAILSRGPAAILIPDVDDELGPLGVLTVFTLAVSDVQCAGCDAHLVTLASFAIPPRLPAGRMVVCSECGGLQRLQWTGERLATEVISSAEMSRVPAPSHAMADALRKGLVNGHPMTTSSGGSA